MTNSFHPHLFFQLKGFDHTKLFSEEKPVWNALVLLKKYLDDLTFEPFTLYPSVTITNEKWVHIGKGTVIEPYVTIEGPVYIGKHCLIRQGAYIRPYSLIGDDCVIGHASEIKHSILFNEAKAPHFNYVGDSILGYQVNLGAGVILANYRLDGQKIFASNHDGKKTNTHRAKFGAIIGDNTSIGCNSVTNPGTLITKNGSFPPLSSLRGYIENG